MLTDEPSRRAARAAPFDPVSPLFRAQDLRPAGFGDVDVAELSAFQRALLAIDGTVTTFLTAWASEPIVVTPVAQQIVAAPANPWLQSTAATPLIERSVMLLGGQTGRLYAYAVSMICFERLSAAHRDGLMAGRFSIGQLLLTPGFESRRECLWYGRDRQAVLPPEVAARSEPDFLARTYRVTSAAQPLMLITERFPWTLRG